MSLPAVRNVPCALLALACVLAASGGPAETQSGVEWRGFVWRPVHTSNTVALDGDALAVYTGDASFGFYGGAFHPTSAAMQTASESWAEATVYDTGADPGVQLNVLLFDTNGSVFLATLGSFRNESDYGAAWRQERSGTIIASSSVKVGTRTVGAHTFGIARRTDGRLEFWVDGDLVDTTPPNRLPTGFNFVYLVAAGSTFGIPASFIDYREGTGSIPTSSPVVAEYNNRALWADVSSDLAAVSFEGLAAPSGFVAYDTPAGMVSQGLRLTGVTPANPGTTPTSARHYLRVVDSAFFPPFYDWHSGAVLHGPPVPVGPQAEGGPNSHIRAALPEDTTSFGVDLMSFLSYGSRYKVVVSTTRGSSELAAQALSHPTRAFLGVTARDPIRFVDLYALDGFPVLDNIEFGTGDPPPSCTFSLTPASLSIPASGGQGSFAVSTGATCSWSAASDGTWTTLLPGSSCRRVGEVVTCPRGPGVVRFAVTANQGPARQATITAGGERVTVRQAAFACTFALDRTSIISENTGANHRIVVTAAAGCPWTASTQTPWTVVSSGTPGLGSGVLILRTLPNTGADRTGTLLVAGQTVTVTQRAGACGALDVTSAVDRSRNGLTLIYPSSYFWSDTVTLRNSGTVVRGPVFLLLDGVPNQRAYPNGTGLLGTSSLTRCFSPNGDALVLVSGADMRPGQTVQIPLGFWSQSLSVRPTFTMKVLSGRPNR